MAPLVGLVAEPCRALPRCLLDTVDIGQEPQQKPFQSPVEFVSQHGMPTCQLGRHHCCTGCSSHTCLLHLQGCRPDVSQPSPHAQMPVQVERERSTIYYQHVSSEMPEMPPAKRIAVAAAWSLPLPASEVAEGAASCFEVNRVQQAQAEATEAAAHPSEALLPAATEQPAQEKDGKGVKNRNDGKHQESSPACWRWLLVIIAMPFLVIISILGLIVWLLLLPVKCFCCPCGCAIQLIYDAFEWLLKAPFRALLWASGKPWKPGAPSKEKTGQNHSESV